ncbi:MAG TPA: tyrosine-type recombinase/integrase [Solirubrobacterales bacterium]|nr:tyrosine-type recombinase/integrase [Solirubrobacterales bacterium]
MARKATGQVIEPTEGRSWAIRFRAYGKRRYVALGTAEDGWNRKRAEAELRHVLADVERGLWRPYEPAKAPLVAEAPTFHEFASEWLEGREPELRPKTVKSYRWLLSGHLLPHFAQLHLDQIGPEHVDRYKTAKLREGTLGPNQINKSIGLLAMILDAAGDYGHVDPARNPARGRRRRVKRTQPSRPTIEPEQLPSLLEAAGRLRPILATMAGAGLRNGEVCALDLDDFDPGSGSLTVATAKTDAGVRVVDLPDALRRELTAHKARIRRREGLLFRNRNGQRQSVSNVERRFKTAIRRANVRLADLGIRPIDEGATPHSLRRLYASLRFALGDDPVYVAAQLGHTEPGFSMKVYASAVRRRERLIGVALREFDAALDWAAMGSGEPVSVDSEPSASDGQSPETAQQSLFTA